MKYERARLSQGLSSCQGVSTTKGFCGMPSNKSEGWQDKLNLSTVSVSKHGYHIIVVTMNKGQISSVKSKRRK